MRPELVPLRFWRGSPGVSLRELTGHDEMLVREVSTRTAVELLSHVVDDTAHAQVETLTASDRDILLAEIYRQTFGPRIDTTVRCTACATPFDLTFSLDELVASVNRAEEQPTVKAQADGTFITQDGLHFRLPTAQAELEVAALPTEEAADKLAEWCILDAPRTFDASVLEAAIEQLAPVLDLEISTWCPECAVQQTVQFDIQFFVLRAIEQERAQLTRDIHRIASAYSWGLAEILDLRRTERRAFVELIDSELPVRRRSR
jgi:hypothetical protein